MTNHAAIPLVQMTLTLEQADAMNVALDLFSRIGMGDLEEIANLARDGLLTRRQGDDHEPLDIDTIEQLETMLIAAKEVLRHPRNGSYGIGHPGVPLQAKRAYEIKKTLAKALWDHRYPGDRSTVHRDGLTVRYTADLSPMAVIVTGASDHANLPSSSSA